MKIQPVTLEGTLVRLEPMGLEHIDALCVHGLDARLWAATTIEVKSRIAMEAYVKSVLEQQNAGSAQPFVIIERASGNVVGTTRYHSIAPDDRRLEIGYTWIGVRWQRTGINTESKLLLLRHAFDIMGYFRVELKANAANHQSRRAIERLGAKAEGILRSYRISPLRGACDLAVYSILRSEWPDVRDNLEAKLTRHQKAG